MGLYGGVVRRKPSLKDNIFQKAHGRLPKCLEQGIMSRLDYKLTFRPSKKTSRAYLTPLLKNTVYAMIDDSLDLHYMLSSLT